VFRRLSLFQSHFPKWIISWVLIISDLIAGFIAFDYIFTRNHNLPLFFTIQAVWLVVFAIGKLYYGQFTVSRLGEFQIQLQITFSITLVYIFLEAIGVANVDLNANEAIQYWFIFMFFSSFFRLLIRSYQKQLLRKGIGRERTIVVGLNTRGKSTANILAEHEQQGYEVVGFVRAMDDPENGHDIEFPILGNETDLIEIINEHRITIAVIALDNPAHNRLMDITLQVNGYPVELKVIPDLGEIVQGFVRTQQIAGLPLISIHPVNDGFYVRFVKKTIDFLGALIFLIITLPLWILIAVAIKLDSKGPVFYKQIRSGYKKREFKILKFRSMFIDAEDGTGPVWAGDEDPRITKIGKILRRFRLDEIPQLINVLKGDMSLVGPRPERPYFVEQLGEQYPFYKRRMNVFPGITGWSQIKHPPDKKIEDVREKLKYDFYYIENISLNLDIKIALSTIWVIISGHGR